MRVGVKVGRFGREAHHPPWRPRAGASRWGPTLLPRARATATSPPNGADGGAIAQGVATGTKEINILSDSYGTALITTVVARQP